MTALPAETSSGSAEPTAVAAVAVVVAVESAVARLSCLLRPAADEPAFRRHRSGLHPDRGGARAPPRRYCPSAIDPARLRVHAVAVVNSADGCRNGGGSPRPSGNRRHCLHTCAGHRNGIPTCRSRRSRTNHGRARRNGARGGDSSTNWCGGFGWAEQCSRARASSRGDGALRGHSAAGTRPDNTRTDTGRNKSAAYNRNKLPHTDRSPSGDFRSK